MIIQYDFTGKIVSVQFDESRSGLTTNPFLSLTVDETPENKDTIFSILQSTLDGTEEFTISNGNLIRNGQAIPTNNDIDLDQYRTQYLSTLDTLSQIENATTPTNAQVVAAVKFLAKTLRLLLKLLARVL